VKAEFLSIYCAALQGLLAAQEPFDPTNEEGGLSDAGNAVVQAALAVAEAAVEHAAEYAHAELLTPEFVDCWDQILEKRREQRRRLRATSNDSE
jgi:hypothetical protein